MMTRVLIIRWETSYWPAATSHVINSLLESGEHPWTSWWWWNRVAILTRWWLSGVRAFIWTGLGAGRLVVSSPIEGQIISNQIESIEMCQGSPPKPKWKNFFSCWNLILLTKSVIILNIAKISYSICILYRRWQHTTAITDNGLLLVAGIFFALITSDHVHPCHWKICQLGGYHSKNTTEILGGEASFSLLAPRAQHCSIQVKGPLVTGQWPDWQSRIANYKV